MKWLFGALADRRSRCRTDLSLPSILKLVLGVLGITYERMRAKAVKLIGERAVAIIEKLVEYIKTLITGGRRRSGRRSRTTSATSKHGDRRHPGLADRDRRQESRRQDAIDVQPGRRDRPGDYRDLQHGDVRDREGQPDPGRSSKQWSTRSPPSPRAQIAAPPIGSSRRWRNMIPS